MTVAFLTVCVLVRVATPLVALAAHDRALPLLPRYHYDPRPGDAFGYYSAARSLLAAWRSPVTLAAFVVIAAVAAGAALLLRRRRLPGWSVVAGAAGLGLIGAVLAARMASAGAPTVGWPLVWSVPLLPYRALGLPLGPNLAFAVGLALSLLAIAVTTVATAALGAIVTGRRATGLVAAAAYSIWPLLTGTLAGHRAWENGTWQVDTGLHLYSEPLSTALVVAALAVFAARSDRDVALALVGALISYATIVRLSNALVAGVVLLVASIRLPLRRVLLLAASMLAFAPIELAYWSKGYTHLPAAAGGLPPRPFSLDYVRIAWTDSLLWRPRVLVLLVPLAVLGTWAVRPPWRLLLWLVIGVTAAFYSVYAVTDIHPRFLYVVFPLLLVLWGSGAALLASVVRRNAI